MDDEDKREVDDDEEDRDDEDHDDEDGDNERLVIEFRGVIIYRGIRALNVCSFWTAKKEK